MGQLAEGLSVPHTSILVFCTLHSNSFLPLIYYKVLFFLAKMDVINCLLAVPLILIDHCQQLHPSYFWLGYLEYSQPVKKATSALWSPPLSQLSLQPGDHGQLSSLSAGMLPLTRMHNSHPHICLLVPLSAVTSGNDVKNLKKYLKLLVRVLFFIYFNGRLSCHWMCGQSRWLKVQSVLAVKVVLSLGML